VHATNHWRTTVLSLTRESQMDKARKTLRDVVSYADEVARDERLRADVRAAAGHGAKASERIKKDLDDGDPTGRLVSDKKLRRNLRALLDDLDSASDRVRRKKSHRVRNVLLMVAGVATTVAVVRLWLSGRRSHDATTTGESVPTV
jgi:hypothetical protein